MKIDSELVDKFLRNQCTTEEARFVLKHFDDYPNELEQYIPLSDWLHEHKGRLHPVRSERMLQHIRELYKNKGRSGLRKKLMGYAIAASVIGLITLAGLKLFTGRQASGEKAVAIVGTGIIQPLKTIENKTAKAMLAVLPDSSKIILYSNSSLQYLPAFEQNRRDLYLKGKARFEVSKDASRPFTVYAAGIATTALGTQFLVSAQNKRNVSVVLMEGIVKVWPQNKGEGNIHVVLHPGDQLTISSAAFSNYSLIRTSSLIPGAEGNKKNKEITKDTIEKEHTGLVFKNQSLDDVFKKVGEKYGMIINYKEVSGIREKLFTGRFLETDNLEFICKTICVTHGLNYSIGENVITISEKKQEQDLIP